MKRAILLARVSKKDQAADDRYSIPAQLREMRQFCAREGIEVVDEKLELGTSGYTSDITKIPGLNDALLAVESGGADCLVVHESSRLARNERLTHEVMDRLEACGARYLNASMIFDYSGSTGRMLLGGEANFNAFWSRKVSEHSKKGKQEQFESGLRIGQIPFGYEAATIVVGGD